MDTMREVLLTIKGKTVAMDDDARPPYVITVKVTGNYVIAEVGQTVMKVLWLKKHPVWLAISQVAAVYLDKNDAVQQ